MRRSVLALLALATLAIATPRFVEDDLELLEPAIVADPVDGARWWYAPAGPAYVHHARGASQKAARRANAVLGRQGEEFRLPHDLKPTRYAVRLLPFVDLIDSQNYTTDGHIEIFFDCITATNNITINAADITFDESSISVFDLSSNSQLDLVRGLIDEQNTRQMVTFQAATQLESGKSYRISMNFQSVLNDQKRGFYRSSYEEQGPDGPVTKWLAVSDFEASDARRAFPCFDEPNMKAEFSITLGRKTHMTSVSNMPQLSSNPIDGLPGYVWDFYQTSVPMSTYLVAFLVSEYKDVPSNPASSPIQFRIWARPEAEPLTSYALEKAPLILEFYQKYLGVPYSLPKEDLVAVPNKDFTAGAMENWGMITYRETDLLIDPTTAAATQIQRVAVVSAHELAHMWFGDLVTLDWWETVWLNEGFAAYFEFFGTDSVEPTFRMLDQFVTANLQYAFGFDGLDTSRPMYYEVNNPSEIGALFDGISYQKASCVIRMMGDIFGLDVFNRGLTRYLTEDSFMNGKQDILWQALQDQADEEGVVLPASVKEIMDPWTFQMGYPYVTVTRDYAENTATVAQERFLLRKTEGIVDDHVYRWWIPLTYTTEASSSLRNVEWLSDAQDMKTIDIKGALNTQWVLFNIDQQNYYRVAYDAVNYDLLAVQLGADHKRISDNSRAQLLDDAFNLAVVDLIRYQSAFNLTKYLKDEREYVPWRAVLGELDYIDNMLYAQKEHADLKTYLTSLIKPYYDSVGFEEGPADAHLTIYSRTDALNWACRLGIADCVQNAQKVFAALMQNPATVLNPNLQKSVVLRTGIENGAQAEWNFALNQYKTTGDTNYLVAVTKTRTSANIYNLLEMMLDDDSGIYIDNVNTLFSNIASNPLGNPIALNFLIQRWDDIAASRLGDGYFVDFFRYLCDRQNQPDQLAKMLQLRADHSDILGTSPTVSQGVAVIRENVRWMYLHQEEIGAWLREEPYIPPEPTDPTVTDPTVTDPTVTDPTVTDPTVPEPTTTDAGNGLRPFYLTSLMAIAVLGSLILN